MEINQRPLFQLAKQENKNTNSDKNNKIFPNIKLSAGLYHKQLLNDFILIHRILQKRSKTIKKLTYTVLNEMKIKNGELDTISLTRDTLINYYLL